MSKDLGTYHVRVEFEDNSGFIMEWRTGARYGGGTDSWSPLTEARIAPIYESEEDVFDNIRYMFEDGNYSCDCNKKLFLDYAAQRKSEEDRACGNALSIKSLTAIRPDGTECVLLGLALYGRMK